MAKFFKKEGKKKILPDEGKSQLADASRRLGFEVGYHRHSEIGWVQEKLIQIYRFADEYDLRDFVKENYNFGKEEGFKAKARDTKSGMAGGVAAAKPDTPVNIDIEKVRHSNQNNINSGYKDIDVSFSSSTGMILQPGLVELPDNIERTKAIEMPSFLEGAKHLTPKKK